MSLAGPFFYGDDGVAWPSSSVLLPVSLCYTRLIAVMTHQSPTPLLMQPGGEVFK